MSDMGNDIESVTEAMAELRRRSGLTRKALAKKMKYAGDSSIQRYEDSKLFTKKYLPIEIAEKFAKALAGLGDPKITFEEVMALAGREAVREAISPQDQRAHADLALNGSDHYMARVLEDVIELLIKKEVLKPEDLYDLPEPARDLIARRQQLRAARGGDDDD